MYSRVEVPCDSIKEFNAAMVDLCDLRESEQWEVRSFRFYNTKLRSKVYFSLLNPDSQGPQLYFERVVDENGERNYEVVSPYEQQELCNYFYDRFAACELRYIRVPEVDCAVKTFNEIKKTYNEIKKLKEKRN